MAVGLAHYLTVAAILFTLGVFGIFLNRKNVIIIMMSIELMLLAVNINFVAFSVVLNDLAHVSSGRILPIPARLVSRSRDEKEQKEYLSVAGMAKVVERFLCRGVWPGYEGWRRDNGEVLDPSDLDRFQPTVRAMAEEAAAAP